MALSMRAGSDFLRPIAFSHGRENEAVCMIMEWLRIGGMMPTEHIGSKHEVKTCHRSIGAFSNFFEKVRCRENDVEGSRDTQSIV